MFAERDRGPSALEGYRSAINSVWTFNGRSLNGCPEIQSLLKTFRAERPRTVHHFPKWDLALVLRKLTLAPFEPLEGISQYHLSLKTVFLLLLASARRVGDIHAIDPKRIHIQPNAVTLQPYPGYLPKTASVAEGERRYMPIVIRRLSNFASEPEDMKLCPVRTLLAYDSFAKTLKAGRHEFFLSLNRPYTTVCKQTIAAWAVKLIKLAYSTDSENDRTLPNVNVQEVRAIAASLLHQATYSIEQVLAMATWASPTTFTSYYLREVSGLEGSLHTISPCIVAGHQVRGARN